MFTRRILAAAAFLLLAITTFAPGAWAEYLRSAGIHPHLFYRDLVHANEYGEQILSKILLAFFEKPPE